MSQIDPLIRDLRIRMMDARLKPHLVRKEAGVSRAAWHRWCNGGDFNIASYRRMEEAVSRLTACSVDDTQSAPSAVSADPTSGERAAGDRPSPLPVARHGASE